MTASVLCSVTRALTQELSDKKKKAPETTSRKPFSKCGNGENPTSANRCQKSRRRFGERISFA